jgi:hypothetical protein
MPSFMSKDGIKAAGQLWDTGLLTPPPPPGLLTPSRDECTARAAAFLAANPSYRIMQNGVSGMSAAGATEFYRQNPTCPPPDDFIQVASHGPSGLMIMGVGVAAVAVIYFLSGR